MNNTEQKVWYAMRATYQRGLDAKQFLDQQGIENFIPMHYEIITRYKRKKRVFVPVIRNLIFVHTIPSIIKQAKIDIAYMQYLTTVEEEKRIPIIVPDFQMQQFIAVAGTYDDQLVYLMPSEINLEKGTKVRVHGGPFDGVEGVFIKIKGVKNKRVVVSIQGITAVATAEIHPDLIEVISQKKSNKLYTI